MYRLLILFSIIFLWTCSSSPTKSEPAPQAPTVNNLTITTNEDTPATFTMTGTDPEGAALTFSISTQPQNGAVTASGAAGTYTPNENFNGTDTFAYIASDGGLNSTAGLVTVTVTAVDDDPNTMNVSAVTDEDNAVEITLEAEEYDGDTISFNIKDNPTSGSVTISGDKATYTPNANYYGADSFTFEAVDTSAKKILNTATASLTINPINDAPVVEAQSVEGWNNQDIELTLTGTDVEGDNISFEIVDNPVNVSASIDGATLTIEKSSSFWGADSLTYKAYDGTEYSNTAKVNIAFKRYTNYNRSSYHLKHTEYWFDQWYFRNGWNDDYLGNEHGVSEADFNGDGYIDVLHSHTWETDQRVPLKMFFGTGDNETFTRNDEVIQNNLGTIFQRKELIGDFNGDNIPDVFFVDSGTHAVGEAHESILLSNGDGTFTHHIFEDIRAGIGTHGGASADIDLDGDLDIVVGYSASTVNGFPSTYFLINDGNANFTYNTSLMNDDPAGTGNMGYVYWDYEFYDLNGDNLPDLAVDGFQAGSKQSNPLISNVNRIFWNQGGGFFEVDSLNGSFSDLPIDFSATPFPNEAPQVIDYCFGDLDGDGNVEVIGSVTWGLYDRGQIYIWSHNGDYNYVDATSNFIEGYAWDGPDDDPIFRLRLQDIDNNGKIDLFRDSKHSSNGYDAMRWEWNGSKFSPLF